MILWKKNVKGEPVLIYSGFTPSQKQYLRIIFKIHLLNPSQVPYEGDTIFCFFVKQGNRDMELKVAKVKGNDRSLGDPKSHIVSNFVVLHPTCKPRGKDSRGSYLSIMLKW